jgi:hypothetical protein
MMGEGTAVVKITQHLVDLLHIFKFRRDEAKWIIPAGKTLGGDQDIRLHLPMVDRPPFAGAAHADKHLIGDEQHAVFIANLANARPIIRRRHHAAQAGAADRFGDEGGDIFRAVGENRLLQPIRQFRAGGVPAVWIRRADVRLVDHHSQVRGAQLRPPADAEGAEGHAVVAEGAADGDVTAVLSPCLLNLSRQLHRSLDDLRTAAEVEETGIGDGDERRQSVRERLHRLVGKHDRVYVGCFFGLPGDRIDHFFTAVTDVDHQRAAGAVDVLFPLFIDKVDSLSIGDFGTAVAHLSIKNMSMRVLELAHDQQSTPGWCAAPFMGCRSFFNIFLGHSGPQRRNGNHRVFSSFLCGSLRATGCHAVKRCLPNLHLTNNCLALFVHVLLHIVEAARRFTGGATALPAAKRLVSRPGAGGRAGRTVDIEHAGFDVVQPPLYFFVILAEEAGGETIFHIIGPRHCVIQIGKWGHGDDGQEHLLFPQFMRFRQIVDDGRGDKIAVADTFQHLTAVNRTSPLSCKSATNSL